MKSIIHKILIVTSLCLGGPVLLFSNTFITQQNNIRLPEQIFPQLNSILAEAEKNAPRTLIQIQRLREAEGERVSSGSRELPQISGAYNVSQIWRKRADRPDYEKNAIAAGSLTIRQAIFHWGGISAEKRMGELRLELSKLNFKQSQDHLLKEIRILYLDLFSQSIQLKAANQNTELAKKNWEHAQSRLSLKMATAQQLEEAYISYQESQLFENNLRQSFENTKLYLTDLSGLDTLKLEFPSSSSELAQKILAANESNTNAHNHFISPRFAQLQKELEIESNNHTRIRAEQLPQFNLVSGVFQDQVDSAVSTGKINRNNFFAGVEVNWNLFDGFRVQGQRLASRARQRRIRIELKEEEKRTSRESINLNQSLISSITQLDIFTRKLAIAEHKLITRQELLEKNIIPHSEYLQFKNRRDEQELSLSHSIKNYFNLSNDIIIYNNTLAEK